MLPEQTRVDGFVEFVTLNERKLRQSLTAALGYETGKEAAAEALAYGWEHWDKVRAMVNPVGYLYVVGRSKGRRMSRLSKPSYPPVPEDKTPQCEPGLPAAFGALAEKERIVVLLLHAYGWHMTEVADTLGVSKSTVQSYSDRAMRKLRHRLGVGR